jgi:hypothetical protein
MAPPPPPPPPQRRRAAAATTTPPLTFGPQTALAAPFLVLGAWALLFPRAVLRLTLTPEYRAQANALSAVLTACFGAQAVMCGAVFAMARCTRATYALFAAGMLPFFAFNLYCTLVVPVFNVWMLLDAASSAAIVAACVWGLRRGRD